MCVDFLYKFCLNPFLILRKVQRRAVINARRSSLRCEIFLSHFNGTLTFPTSFQEILHIEIHENPSSGSGGFHTDRPTDERADRQAGTQTDMTRPKDAYLSYA